MCKPVSKEYNPKDKAPRTEHSKMEKVTQSASPKTHADSAETSLSYTVFYGSASMVFLIGGFSLCMPYAQARRDEIGCDAFCQGGITSLRSALSLVGAALVGRVSDMGVGMRKKCLIVGALSAVVDLSILGTTRSLTGLWASVVCGSLLQQNFSVLKAAVSECYEEQRKLLGSDGSNYDDSAMRAGSVGKLGMSVGLSFMVGPLLAGRVVHDFNTAVAMSIVSVLISLILINRIPETPGHLSSSSLKRTQTTTSKFSQFFDLSAARSPPALFFLALRLGMALAFHIFNVVWTASLKRRFNFGPAEYGQFFSYIGLVFALSQGLVAGRLIRLFGHRRRVTLIVTCCILLGLGRWFAFRTQSLLVVYVLFFGIISALGTLNTIVTADTGKIVASDQIGGLMGLLDAVQSGAGMIGPLVGGALTKVPWGNSKDEELNTLAPLIAVVSLYGFLALLVFLGYDKYVTEQSKKIIMRRTNEVSTKKENVD